MFATAKYLTLGGKFDMIDPALITLNEAYYAFLEQQYPDIDNRDYSILENHTTILNQLSSIGNSRISVFDTYRKSHVFSSSNNNIFLGYQQQEIETDFEHFIRTRIHVDDHRALLEHGLSALKLFSCFATDEKLNHKFIAEYRIQNSDGVYVRVVEQQQVLALDNDNNLWLALSILDTSPNQKNMDEGFKSEILNFNTGRIISLNNPNITDSAAISLTDREMQILKLVKAGLLSKEISDQLAISVHTVNTHRQKVLAKLGVNNSIEAVSLASKLGLL